MPTYQAPGIYVEEQSSGSRPIEGVSTSVAAFVGVTEKGPLGAATLVTSFSDFVRQFGGPLKIVQGAAHLANHYLYYTVSHFFAQRGTRCYVVRVVHYSDLDTAATAAIPASAPFAGTSLAGAAVAGALSVRALNPGRWGESLSVGITRSSRFSVLLADPVGAAGDTQVTLVDNTDVVAGSLLWIVEEASGVVQGIDAANNSIIFQEPLQQGSQQFDGDISDAVVVRVVSADLQLDTTTNMGGSTVHQGAGDAAAPTGIILASNTKFDGSLLRNGDVLSFIFKQALVIVDRISTTTAASTGETAMLVRLPSGDTVGDAFDQNKSRAYALDFRLRVEEDGNEVEVHENLSLVETNTVDHVNVRLGAESGNSQYIVADEDTTTSTAVLVDPAALTPLGSGNDGLSGLNDADFVGSEIQLTGLRALDRVKDASILCLPNASGALATQVLNYCNTRQDLLYIIDAPDYLDPAVPSLVPPTVQEIVEWVGTTHALASKYGAIYYPWIKVADPFTGADLPVPPSGAVAGVYAYTDAKRGVQKAPAGTDTALLSVASGVEQVLTKADNDTLLPARINAIRSLPGEGIVVWGSRTLATDAEWRYVNVRRLFTFLEQSIERGTQWTAFEPNDATLWKNIRRNVASFLRLQWLEGKLAGGTEEAAFFVKCDEETNPPEVVDAGQVVTEIGAAPLKPAEFVIFRIKQFAGTESA